MDLISVASVLWKQKWLVIPVVLLTVAAAGYVVKIRPPVYDATSTVLLVKPVKQATQSQIADHPGLQRANSDNVFEDYGDLDIVANAVIDYIRSPASAAQLSKAGAGTAYQLGLSGDPGSPPIIDITGVGSSAIAAIKSSALVTAAVQQELATMQLRQGVDSFYLIGGDNIVKPTQAQLSASARLRPLAGVIGAGLIVLILAVWTGEAAVRRRYQRDGLPPRDEYLPQQDEYFTPRDEYVPAEDGREPAVRGPFEPAHSRPGALR